MISPDGIEPCGIEERIPLALSDPVLTIQGKAADLGRNLHPDSAAELRAMTRIMNAYYSNLIEGHNTRPSDIEAALEGRLDDTENRPLAEEATAHVRVQQWIDDLSKGGASIEPTSQDFIRAVHKKFYDEMPVEFRTVVDGHLRAEIIPGVYRTAGQEVRVGDHYPPKADIVPRCMAYFEGRFRGLTRGRTGAILSIPAAHHRFNHIHPFVDGNGRVSRLMSHAMAQSAGIHGRGLWSISRGLARGLREPAEYKERMRSADTPRQGDRDGRGNLSLSRLESFSAWFLTVALDQITFTDAMFDLKGLEKRYSALLGNLYPEKERLPKLIRHVLKLGEMQRGDAQFVTGTQDRAARKDLATLFDGAF